MSWFPHKGSREEVWAVWIQRRRLEEFLHPIEEDQEENLCLPQNLYKHLFLYLVSWNQSILLPLNMLLTFFVLISQLRHELFTSPWAIRDRPLLLFHSSLAVTMDHCYIINENENLSNTHTTKCNHSTTLPCNQYTFTKLISIGSLLSNSLWKNNP